jgi:tetratricopeptide (TPR) repeat protein
LPDICVSPPVRNCEYADAIRRERDTMQFASGNRRCVEVSAVLDWLRMKIRARSASRPTPARSIVDSDTVPAEAHSAVEETQRSMGPYREIAEQTDCAPATQVAALAKLAELRQEEGRIEEAESSIEKALRTCPEDADLNYRLGLHWLAQEDFEQALDLFNLALHYRAGLFEACVGQVKALKALGRTSEEPQAYRRFLEANPKHAEATLALAAWHYTHADHDAAVELLEPFARADIPDRYIDNLLGLILGRERGEFERAEVLLRRALDPDPSWSPAVCNLGWILL